MSSCCVCVCVLGWTRTEDCPTGDDPHTPGVPEVQVIQCSATGGSFVLSFRQYVTVPIYPSDGAADLKAKLEVRLRERRSLQACCGGYLLGLLVQHHLR